MRRRGMFGAAGLLAVVGVATASPAAASEVMIFAKPGATIADMRAADDRCVEEAKRRPVAGPDAAGQYSTAYAAGGALGAGAVAGLSGFAQGVHQVREFKRREEACMRRLGFGHIDLTSQEAAEYMRQSDDAARTAWGDRWMSGDISARVAASMKPAVLALPAVPAKPFAVGGVLMDPITLSASGSPAGKNGVLLTGKAVHRGTAKLAQPFDTGGVLKISGEAETVFYAVEPRARPADDPEVSAIWCGPMSTKSLLAGTDRHPVCFISGFQGYHTLFWDAARGYAGRLLPWLAGAPDDQGAQGWVKQGSLILDVSATDLIGPMDVSLKLIRLSKKDVTLAAVAERNGETVEFWRAAIPLTDGGTTVLPSWTHRLTLTRKGDGVEAKLSADGDGAGWLDLPVPSAG